MFLGKFSLFSLISVEKQVRFGAKSIFEIMHLVPNQYNEFIKYQKRTSGFGWAYPEVRLLSRDTKILVYLVFFVCRKCCEAPLHLCVENLWVLSKTEKKN